MPYLERAWQGNESDLQRVALGGRTLTVQLPFTNFAGSFHPSSFPAAVMGMPCQLDLPGFSVYQGEPRPQARKECIMVTWPVQGVVPAMHNASATQPQVERLGTER